MKQYYRDPAITAILKIDANGTCDLVIIMLPLKMEKMFHDLENHHITYRCDGGKDTIDNCVSLYPNCHRKMHILNKEQDRTKLFSIAKKRILKY